MVLSMTLRASGEQTAWVVLEQYTYYTIATLIEYILSKIYVTFISISYIVIYGTIKVYAVYTNLHNQHLTQLICINKLAQRNVTLAI